MGETRLDRVCDTAAGGYVRRYGSDLSRPARTTCVVSHVSCLAFLLTAPAVAQPITSVEQISPIDRPQDHFYGAIAGNGPPKVRWELSASSAPFGTPVVLSLVVLNAVNPHELTRPPLLALDEFSTLFSVVEDLPDEPNAPAGVTFRYKVTPRNDGKLTVPELTFNYFEPRAPAGKKTQTIYARGVQLTVTKPPQPSPDGAVALVGPAEFFERREGVFARSSGPAWWMWVALFAAGIVSAVGWVVGWRVFFPDAARLARIRHHKAVRTALDRLRKGHPTAEQVALSVRNYLIARWGLAFTAQTPAEVATGLVEVGLPAERAAEAEALLRACDAARFGGDTVVSANRAAAMIERWEGVSPPSG